MAKYYKMAHSIRIEDEELYNELISYCRENGMRIGKFCESLLREGLSMEKYGDIPYGEIRRPAQRHGCGPKEKESESVDAHNDSRAASPENTTTVIEGDETESTNGARRKPRKRIL